MESRGKDNGRRTFRRDTKRRVCWYSTGQIRSPRMLTNGITSLRYYDIGYPRGILCPMWNSILAKLRPPWCNTVKNIETYEQNNRDTAVVDESEKQFPMKSMDKSRAAVHANTDTRFILYS